VVAIAKSFKVKVNHMKLFRYNYFADYKNHVGEQWALCAYDVERSILVQCPYATGIDVWVI
jgi:hypothetical protein